MNANKVRKLTSLMAGAIKKSNDVFTAQEMIAALEEMLIAVKEMAEMKAG